MVFVGWLVLGVGVLAAKEEQFSIQSWQTDEGLPQNTVTGVFQGSDGYIWIGTYNGMARFDGIHFTVFDSANTPGLKNSRITSLYQTSDKTIWIGHETGEISCLRDGRFTNSFFPHNWPKEEIVAISEDEQGDVWALNLRGMLQRMRDQKILLPPVPVEPNSLARPSFSEHKNGELYVLFRGAVALLHRGELIPAGFDDGTGTNYVEQVCGSKDAGEWVIGGGHIRKWKQNAWMQDLGSYTWSNVFITTAFETRGGTLCVGTIGDGLFLLNSNAPALHLNRANGLPHDWVRCLTEDQEGNIWVGTGGGGLSVLRATKVTMRSPPDEWEGRVVLSLTRTKNGDFWAGTEGAGLYCLSAQNWKHYGFESGLPNQFIWSVLEDRDSNLWVGTWGDGLFKRVGNKFVPAPGFQPNKIQVTALYEGKDGAIWAGTGVGLLRYQNDVVTQYGRSAGVTFTDIRTIIQAADGTVWFGTMGGGLGCLREGHITTFTKQDGLASDFILSLYLDTANTLWIGTLDNGLSRMKNGQFKTISSANGLDNNIIGHIAEDQGGWFWLTSQAGILRVGKVELNAVADGLSESVDCLIYGKNQGLSTLACSAGFQPSGVQTIDGHFWFPTAKGMAEVDPKAVRKNNLPPPIHIESADIGGHVTPIESLTAAPDNLKTENSLRTLVIPPDKQRLSLKFTALSFIEPEAVRFRYRLTPLETGWMEGGSQRAVDYSYVPPGKYEFTVIACNNDGFWNNTGDTIRVIVLPHFWQTMFFKLSVTSFGLFIFGGGIVLTQRARLKRKLESAARESAIERERVRIAQDIHDDLGASLTRIGMLSQTAQETTDDADWTSNYLTQIYDSAREMTRGMDEIVWAVNPRHDTLESLFNYLTRFAHEFLTPAKIRLRLEAPLEFPERAVGSEVRHNLFLAFKEALNNAVRHSGADEIQVRITLEADNLRVAVSDNGHGLAAGRHQQRSGDCDRIVKGQGLSNIQARLKRIGGESRIIAQPGQGMCVEFMVQLT
jgi:ligand-binding sensor domain-containing protein/signal transduction histidine kinase